MNRVKLIWVAILLLTALLLFGCQTAAPTEAPKVEEPPTAVPTVVEPAPGEGLKVALLLYGPLSDTGWNATAYQGLLDAQDEFGIEVAFTEDVQVPDIEQALRDYSSQGYDLVIGHSFPFMDPMVAVSPDFPATKFAATNGFAFTDNMASFFPFEVQSHYLAGILMGLMTKSNVIGVVGGVELPQ